MKNQVPLDEVYKSELLDTIQYYASELATWRRLKENTQDQDIKDAITGIIQDELTIIEHYRRELL